MNAPGIWMHIIWATKAYEPCLVGGVADYLNDYLIGKSADLGARVKGLNVQPEHVHILIDLPVALSLSDFMHELKGASSYWVNKHRLCKHLFRWQKGFDAYSVGEEDLYTLLHDFEDQTVIHKSLSFQAERKVFREKAGTKHQKNGTI
ncbi:MAG: IS200/IS605 family transposase [Bacteroidales bacterium]|nr:IS200/IS605 family transposase [Bacteroidales bacterium]